MELKIYDTTLRDGTQAEDFCFSAGDKVRIALKLDDIGLIELNEAFAVQAIASMRELKSHPICCSRSVWLRAQRMA